MKPLWIIAAGVAALVVLNRATSPSWAAPAPDTGPLGSSLNPPGGLYPGQQAPIGGNPNMSPQQRLQIQQFQALSGIAASGAASAAAIAGLTATAATGVGAIVAAAIIAFGLLRGTAHLVANEWTMAPNGIQYKFNMALGAIVDAKDASLRNKAATKTSVHYAKTAVQGLYQAYKVAGEQFALQSNDHRRVITQSYTKLDPIVSQIVSDMEGQIAGLAY